MTRVVLIGPPSLRCDSVARILGEALGWMSWDTRLLAGRVTGRIPRGEDPERGAIAQRVFHYISDVDSYRHAIISLLDLDTLTAGNPLHTDCLTAQAQAMLTADDVFPILLIPSASTLQTWAQRQRDGLLPYESVWDVNRADVAQHVQSLTRDFLRANRPGPGEWEALEVCTHLPWWDPAPRTYMEPVIGDHLVRIAYQLAHRIVRGKTTTVRGTPGTPGHQRSPVLALAKNSLLYTHQDELRKDPAVNGLLKPSK